MNCTTEEYWDCECVDNFIHPKSEPVCVRCGRVAEEQPDSITSEVLAAGLPLARG